MYFNNVKEPQKRWFKILEFIFSAFFGDVQFLGLQKISLKSTKIQEIFFHGKQTYKYIWCEYYLLWTWVSIPTNFWQDWEFFFYPPLFLLQQQQIWIKKSKGKTLATKKNKENPLKKNTSTIHPLVFNPDFEVQLRGGGVKKNIPRL